MVNCVSTMSADYRDSFMRMGFIWTIIIDFIAGMLAKFLMPEAAV